MTPIYQPSFGISRRNRKSQLFSAVTEVLESRRLLSAVLVKDINNSTLDSNPNKITDINGTAFFAATTPQLGTELYKSDGTTTTLVKDINPGTGTSYLDYIVKVGTVAVFRAYDVTNGYSLWKSDGTGAGTTILKKNCNPQYNAVMGGKAYFYAYDPTTFKYGLWVSDGTAAGTKVVKADLYITSPGITAIGTKIYFSAYPVTGTNYGYELWTSDGTGAGTKLVKDIYVGNGSSSPRSFASAGGKLVFQAYDSFSVNGLYKTDGTTTTLIKNNYSPQNPVGIGNFVYFNGISDVSNPNALWKLDVTNNAISVLKANVYSSNLTAVGSKLFFTGYDTTDGYELWVSDGTSGGTKRVENTVATGSTSPDHLFAVGNMVYFESYSEPNNQTDGLWKSDGTSAGTVKVKDVEPLNNYDYVGTYGAAAVGGKAFFSAYTRQNGHELWVSDGTALGTKLAGDVNINTNAIALYSNKYVTTPNGKLYFIAQDPIDQLYYLNVSDGSSVGTIKLAPRYYNDLVAVGNKVFFTAYDAANANQVALFVSDGTVAGTKRVGSAVNGPGTPSSLIAGASKVFFYASQIGSSNYGIWTSDGTSGGTKIIGSSLYLYGSAYSATVGTTTFFTAYSYVGTLYGYELYKTDGNTVSLVKDIYVGNGSSYPQNLTAAGTTLFFIATDAFGDNELYKSNGTSAGTVLVKNINATTGSNITKITAMGSKVFFTAYDGAVGSQYSDLYVSDGTSAGTKKVKSKLVWNSNAGVVLNGAFYFHGYDYNTAVTGLFKTDGVTVSTINTALAPYITTMVVVQNKIFFDSYDAAGGYELWKTDGTSGGTKREKDILPGTTYGYPQNLISSGNNLYFTYDNNVVGREWWTVQAPFANIGGPYTVVEGSTLVLSGALSTDRDPAEVLTYKWDLDGDGIFGETGAAAGNGDETGKTPTFKSAGLGAATSKVVSLEVFNGVTLVSQIVNTTIKITPKPANTLTFTKVGTAVTLNWLNSSAIESGFKVQRSIDNISFSTIFTTAANILTYKDTTGLATKKYYYRIVATNANGDAVPSNFVTVQL